LLPLLLMALFVSGLCIGALLFTWRVWRGRRLSLFGGGIAEARRQTHAVLSPFDAGAIPGFEVREKLGSGGMANVYRARRRRDGRWVALKVPAEAFTRDAEFVRRFHREAEVAKRLIHPNVVRTFEHGSAAGKHYMVMEFVDGVSLESYVDVPEHLEDYATSRELMLQAVRALRYIHAVGVLHRDLKPANMMIRRDGLRRRQDGVGVAPDALKLMDFGVASAWGEGETPLVTAAGAELGRVGTPSYMSPEGARGLKTDERSDVYSLGLVFYELLTGKPAFRGGYEVVMHQQIFALPPPPRQHVPNVPCDLEALVVAMIAKDPQRRPDLATVEARLESASLRASAPPSGDGGRLLCALASPEGALRVWSCDGQQHTVLGKLEAAGGMLPAWPRACAGDASGALYVAVHEEGLQADYPMIYKLSPGGNALLAFGRYGMEAGSFLRPVALAVAPDGTLLVLDAETHLIQRFSARGELLACFGGQGATPGCFSDPRDLQVDARGDLYVLDYGNQRVQRLDPRGRYQSAWELRVDGQRLPLGGFALAPTGTLYLAEAGRPRLHQMAPSGDELGTVALTFATEALGQNASPAPRRAGGGRVEGVAAVAESGLVREPPHPRFQPRHLTLHATALPHLEVAGAGVADALSDLGVDEKGYLFFAERGQRVISQHAPDGTLVRRLETYAPILQFRFDVSAGGASP
jgi:hypothetical protein